MRACGDAGMQARGLRACGLPSRCPRRGGALNGGYVMDADVMFLDCPAYMDKHGAVRCGLPAEVEHRYTVRSTEGPLESARIRCPRGHWFNGPIESLTRDRDRAATPPEQEAPAAGMRLRD